MPASTKLRQEDCKNQVDLGYMVRSSLSETTKRQRNVHYPKWEKKYKSISQKQ
jgi:hypothetical protein